MIINTEDFTRLFEKSPRYMLSNFKLWIFKKIVCEGVIQSQYHQDNITKMYQIIANETRREFNETTTPGVISFLQECHRGVKYD